MGNLLEVKNLFVSINTKEGELQAVRNVSFSLKKGEVLAILGESGSGKSILCKSLLQILPKNGFIKNGEIYLEGRELTRLPEKSMNKIRGKEISMIFQDPMTVLNPIIPVGQQIMEAVLTHEKMSKLEAKKRSIELLMTVGIDYPEKRFYQFPFQFSGGMRQRIAIAIAIACKPKVLIADEPTTALDVSIQRQILDLIRELQVKFGISIIFITHDLGVVANLAQRIVVMYAGKFVETGTTEEIFYDARHPYTWGLLSSLPDVDCDNEFLSYIPGMPPNLINPPEGDAFAPRNKYALRIDYYKEPPMFKITETHSAATWLLHKDAPKIESPIKFKECRVIR
ncbi:peptide ABC transporter ATP-binding protein [Fervidicella metallireducens AeB]|uniref:Peptide ABC transporter ATP-binding protein n=1 Tax=Fervidicella metallireducens AeB TaxID=1403537 RepID=A0A017RZP2_9CLOT|nr:ABC transporter ATP-binding protein [Fervidicella metallireducens]EYE89405.1 peptide ABC transporter ATP-binding protein [Fervidicella metallireducens AeB]